MWECHIIYFSQQNGYSRFLSGLESSSRVFLSGTDINLLQLYAHLTFLARVYFLTQKHQGGYTPTSPLKPHPERMPGRYSRITCCLFVSKEKHRMHTTVRCARDASCFTSQLDYFQKCKVLLRVWTRWWWLKTRRTFLSRNLSGTWVFALKAILRTSCERCSEPWSSWDMYAWFFCNSKIWKSDCSEDVCAFVFQEWKIVNNFSVRARKKNPITGKFVRKIIFNWK